MHIANVNLRGKIMKLSHEEMIEVISQDGKLSAMRYTFCQQMSRSWIVVIAGMVIIAGIITAGFFRGWAASDMALLIGTISGATTALAGTLAGIATAGKVTQTAQEVKTSCEPEK